jgi:pilus assembly protein Flp/PilA
MITSIRNFVRDESGATAIEYGLIAALVSVAIIGALTAMKDGLTTTFNKVATELNTASN